MGKAKAVDKVNEILNSIKKVPNTDSKEPEQTETKVSVPNAPRGKPKSGRVWKTPKQRFSTLRKTKNSHRNFAEKEALRLKLNQVKKASKEILEQNKLQKEHQKQRRRENMKKAEEKRLKTEIVQVISNSSKIKRMKKKQLKFIEKRDTTVVSK